MGGPRADNHVRVRWVLVAARAVVCDRNGGTDDVGLSPRKIWTGVPIKILNYLATGLPVVACKSAAQYLLDEGSGALVEDTPEAFAQGALETLKRKKGRQQKIRKNFAA